MKKEDDIKYDVAALTETLVFPSGQSTFLENDKQVDHPSNVNKEVAELIAAGYELYHAIPFSTQSACGIKYILRRKRKPFSFNDKKFRLAMIHAGLKSSLEQAIVTLLVDHGMKGAWGTEVKDRIMAMIESSTMVVEDKGK